MRQTYDVELLTPCFCAGADPAKPEIRVPSIRGHLRDWHEWMRLGPVADTWGGVHGTPKASKVALRLVTAPNGMRTERILPHKQGGGVRNATSAGQEFRVEMLARDAAAFGCAKDVFDAWCLLGSLGLRGSRAAGSVWRPEFLFADVDTFAKRLRDLRLNYLDVWVADKPMDAVTLRETASDTVAQRDLFGGINPRDPSPVRMKAVRIGGGLRLLVWSHRPLVQKAIQALQGKPAPLRWQALRFVSVGA